MPDRQHISSAFDRDLEALQTTVMKMGGTDFREARVEIMMVGKVIRVSTSPPTMGADCGRPAKLMKIARPRIPNTMEGTAAKLEILTSIISVSRFVGANSSR